MSVVEGAGGMMQAGTEAAPLPIIVGEAGELRSMPRAKPAGDGFGYLHGYRLVPVPCSWNQLVQACRDGQALLAWTPETDEVIAPPLVPRLAQAILDRDRAGARTQLRSVILVAAVVCVLSLLLPYGWVFLPLCAALVWFSHVQARRLEAATPEQVLWRLPPGEQITTPDQVLWRLPPDAPAAPALRVPAPYTSAVGYALTAVAVAQAIVLGAPWLEGAWEPARAGGGVPGVMGAPLLHDGFMSMLFNWAALMAFGAWVERQAPRAYVPLAFVAGALVALLAELVLPGGVMGGATGGVMGIAGFSAVLARRHAGLDRSSFGEWLGGTPVNVVFAALLLIIGFASNPVAGSGLLAGIGLGLLAIARPGELEDSDGSQGREWMEWLGSGSIVLVWLSALAAIAALLIG